jgi:putative Ca2+/H+ antiporter (TMEM165/GDT1 family)
VLKYFPSAEIGDKTFFIAALMGMAHPFYVIFLGCGGALWVMTLLSVALGWAAPTLVSIPSTLWQTAANKLSQLLVAVHWSSAQGFLCFNANESSL